MVIQDAASYHRMLDEIERLQAVAGIHRGLDAMKRGKTRPLDAVLQDLNAKHE